MPAPLEGGRDHIQHEPALQPDSKLPEDATELPVIGRRDASSGSEEVRVSRHCAGIGSIKRSTSHVAMRPSLVWVLVTYGVSRRLWRIASTAKSISLAAGLNSVPWVAP